MRVIVLSLPKPSQALLVVCIDMN